jgi:hypothetical protein
MIKLYIGQLEPNIPCTEILFPNLGNQERENPFGEKIFESFTKPIVEIVTEPALADYLCIPHNFNYVKNNQELISSFEKLAKLHNKKILIFYPGDSDLEVPVSRPIVFRNSQYGYKKKINEVIMPGFAADLGARYGMESRSKGEKAVIGFCGWASYGTLREWLSYFASNARAMFGNQVHKKGLYFRRKTLKVLEKSNEVACEFIIRSSYSGSGKTIAMDAQTSRREYVENMKKSDFVLAPKGDGNFSVRFFESLSLGRIPLLIDTNCVLPFEEEIKYDDFILRVDHTRLSELPTIVKDFYENLSPEELLEKQKLCRNTFENYLKIDVFFAHVMTEAFLGKMSYTIDHENLLHS